tara:strand:+ start:17069 stop:17245 length:177 start_codon:yes stop_codon:yes gene_type:complete
LDELVLVSAEEAIHPATPPKLRQRSEDYPLKQDTPHTKASLQFQAKKIYFLIWFERYI